MSSLHVGSIPRGNLRDLRHSRGGVDQGFLSQRRVNFKHQAAASISSSSKAGQGGKASARIGTPPLMAKACAKLLTVVVIEKLLLKISEFAEMRHAENQSRRLGGSGGGNRLRSYKMFQSNRFRWFIIILIR
jgi:hypothetical protein